MSKWTAWGECTRGYVLSWPWTPDRISCRVMDGAIPLSHMLYCNQNPAFLWHLLKISKGCSTPLLIFLLRCVQTLSRKQRMSMPSRETQYTFPLNEALTLTENPDSTSVTLAIMQSTSHPPQKFPSVTTLQRCTNVGMVMCCRSI